MTIGCSSQSLSIRRFASRDEKSRTSFIRMNLFSRCFFLTSFVASTTTALFHGSTSDNRNSHLFDTIAESLRHRYPSITSGKPNIWEMVQIAALCSLIPGIWYFRVKHKDRKSLTLIPSEGVSTQSSDAESSNGKYDSIGGTKH